MNLNAISPAEGSRSNRKRVGRGIGCGQGKTCGRGHKGARSRTGASRKKLGFEGGQTPLHRRLPKVGFSSRMGKLTTKLRVSELNKLSDEARVHVDLLALKLAGLVSKNTKFVKIYASGEINQSVTIVGLPVSAGARALIEKAGGKVQD